MMVTNSSFLNTRIIYSVLFYVLLIVLIVLAKPQIMFDRDGKMKEFGVGEEKSVFSFGLCSMVLAIISFFIFCLVDVIFKNRMI